MFWLRKTDSNQCYPSAKWVFRVNSIYHLPLITKKVKISGRGIGLTENM